MMRITQEEYNAVPEAYKGVWTTERWDITGWREMRGRYIGKRTLMVYDNGVRLLVEGMGLEIIDV